MNASCCANPRVITISLLIHRMVGCDAVISAMVRIVFFDIQGWEKPLLRKLLKGHTLVFQKESLTEETVKLARGARIISVFIHSRLSKKVIEHLSAKLIVTRSTGFDHIDLATAEKKGITVTNVPEYGSNTVAEHTFALILALSRKVHKAYVKILRQDYTLEGLKGFDLQGKTLGVIGTGKIGLHVIRIAKGFGMRVIAYDAHPNRLMSSLLGYAYASFEKVLREADILTLHVPLTPSTKHLLNRQTFKLMKKGSLLINTSRGQVVELDALRDALDSGRLAGAGLDVLEGEELLREEKELIYKPHTLPMLETLEEARDIIRRDNVVFTPHIAFYSQEALNRILETTAENITAFLAGRPVNVVKPACR